MKDYTESVSEEGLRTGEFNNAIWQAYLGLSSRFDSEPAAQTLEVLTEALDDKVIPSGNDVATVVSLATLTGFLKAASMRKVSDMHVKWLAFLL